MAQAVSLRLQPEDVVVSQLAIGGHVDHRIVRAAAELLDRPLWYDVDIPYVFNNPEELEPATALLEGVTHPVSESSLLAWQQAILAYTSQFSTLFSSPDAMRESLHAYQERAGGIRLWREER
jgi:hypothetical protein